LERDEASVLAAEYALGLLAQAERRDVARLLLDDRDMQAELVFWEERFTSLLPAWGGGEPPPRILKKLQAELFGESKQTLLDELSHPSNRRTLIAVGVAKVALIGALIWLYFAG